jgi:hypothetical protein
MADPAPTASYILANHCDLSIACDTCRVLRLVPGLAERIVASGRGDVPVNELRFRCEICGSLGEPWVRGAGNMMMGRVRLWPPEG